MNDLIESFSGVRGIYGQSITEKLAFRYAFCFAKTFYNKESVLIIGGDSRPSTNSLKQAMLKGFAEAGIKKVINVGLLPVQATENAVISFKASGGVYITASHNEP